MSPFDWGLLQGLKNWDGVPGTGITYSTYDINRVRQQVHIITEFMQWTQLKVIITEFGALRWAKDSDKYLNHLIAVFEERKVEWIFHSMAGWNGWNPTFTADREESQEPHGGDETPALQILKHYWQLNQQE